MRTLLQTFFDAALKYENKAVEMEYAAAQAFARGDLNAQRFQLLLAGRYRECANEQLLHASNYETYDQRVAAGLDN